MKRRNFLFGIGALGIASAVGFTAYRRAPGDLSGIDRRPPLAMPPLVDTTRTGRFELTALAGETRFAGGPPTPTLGYGRSFLGPVVRLRSGGLVRAAVGNAVGAEVTTHWHGLMVPGISDGGPHLPIATGRIWRPELDIVQGPATAWFHTHIHGRTAQQVYAGLAGGLIIADGRDDERAIPSRYGLDDLFLVLQDRQFAPDGRMIYQIGMMGRMHGFHGETMLVNGQVGAAARVPAAIVRLRLLNGCNARTLALAFDDGRPLHLIATDGGFLSRPVALREIRLSPGERAEILVDFKDGRPAMLTSRNDPNNGPGNMMGRFRSAYDSVFGNAFEVLPFLVDDRLAGRITTLPDDLGGGEPDLAAKVARERRFTLDMGMGGMRMGGMMGGFMGINGRPFDMRRIDLEVGLGTVERWRVSSSMLAHPFHVHGAMFQVVSENGGAPRPENRGWKDTVLIDREAELLVAFDQPASAQYPFMFHCHNLEHEDAGMMGQFTVS